MSFQEFERNLSVVKKLAKDEDWLIDFAVHESALLDNIRSERRYGSSEQLRHDRYRIIDQLNDICLKKLNVTFNDVATLIQLELRSENKVLHEDLVNLSTSHQSNISANTNLMGSNKRWALLVGVDSYEDARHFGALTVCSKDVESIHQQLLFSGFENQKVQLLNDDTDELPSRDNIYTKLISIAKAAEVNDLFLFYYSGHGMEEDGESYLVGRNGRATALLDTAVSISRVKVIMEQSPARAKVLIIDACHSGANLGAKAPTERMSEGFIRRVFEEAEGIAILASCKQNQVSYVWKEKGQSVFTYYLLEAIKGMADFDKKGFITVQDASRYIINGVKEWAASKSLVQTPTLQAEVAGDIIICKIL